MVKPHWKCGRTPFQCPGHLLTHSRPTSTCICHDRPPPPQPLPKGPSLVHRGCLCSSVEGMVVGASGREPEVPCTFKRPGNRGARLLTAFSRACLLRLFTSAQGRTEVPGVPPTGLPPGISDPKWGLSQVPDSLSTAESQVKTTQPAIRQRFGHECARLWAKCRGCRDEHEVERQNELLSSRKV